MKREFNEVVAEARDMVAVALDDDFSDVVERAVLMVMEECNIADEMWETVELLVMGELDDF